MRFFMEGKLAGVLEGLLTDGARVRPFVGMSIAMLSQTVLRREVFRAYITLEFLLWSSHEIVHKFLNLDLSVVTIRIENI